jgi:protein-S-isoprenylcysteine O-methyltransferase Ste14
MGDGTIFRIAFFILLGAMLVVRTAFSMRVHQQGERTMPDRQAIQNEGIALFATRVLLFFLLIAILVLYAIDHPWMEVLNLGLPVWLRWLGFAIGWLGLALLMWAEIELGRQFSPQLQIRQAHKLITSGPYTHIRHPLYAGLDGFGLGLALVSANWFFVAFFIITLILLGARVSKEERMMVEQFGETYQVYMHRTGRYFPRI